MVQNVARGDETSMAALYDASRDVVYAVALRILADPADAEEVTFDTYIQVWRSASTFSGERGSAMAWLVTMARSRALDRARSIERRKKEQSVADVPEIASKDRTPEELSLQSQAQKRVAAAMGRLSPDQRRAIELAFYSGLTHSELAETLGEPLGTVKTRIRLGMLKLREALSEFSQTHTE
ncbi:MAG TPA: sigma-70 family RNA polymerase sigma factor [Bryobacteraceae bacterium]|nr:sigma-70 family RNA polymerase sigma factor [Bryobacteraceae bacterium]